VINERCIATRDTSCVDVCPVDAITTEDTVPPEWHEYIERNAAYYRS
jgi:Fe-S-cluster-containing hydrogenase component 2